MSSPAPDTGGGTGAAMSPAGPLAGARDLFDLPDDVTYLNCAQMAPFARPVQQAGQAAIERRARPWRITQEDFFEETERARALFAALVGADAEGVAIIPSVSYGLAVGTAHRAPAPGQRIVLLEAEFPSNVYPWRELARRHLAEVHTVPRPADADWTTAVLAALDERVAIVALPNAHWTDGSVVDLSGVSARCRDLGAALVLDVTQSAGAFPLDVGELQPDFLVTAGYKWLLGPYTAGFLYVHPRHRGGRPIEQNWIARRGSEDFASLVDYHDEYQPGARRFDVGERSNFSSMPMTIAALELVGRWGVGAISARTGELTAVIEQAAAARGFAALPAGRRVPHIIGIRRPEGLPRDLVPRLRHRRVYVSQRGDSVRVAPHVYNTEEDVARLFDALGAELS